MPATSCRLCARQVMLTSNRKWIHLDAMACQDLPHSVLELSEVAVDEVLMVQDVFAETGVFLTAVCKTSDTARRSGRSR